MLMSFSFSNFLSFKDKETISFETNKKSNRLSEQVLLDGNNKINKGLVCFGANASGKTNLIRTIASIRRIIITNFKEKNKYNTFKINNNNQISSFEFKFSIDGEILFYEILIDFENDIIISEKLHNGKKHGVYFDRYYDNDKIIISTSKKLSKEDKKFFDVYSMDFNTNQDDKYKSYFFLRYVAKKRSDESDYYKAYKNVFGEILKIIVIYSDTEFGGILRMLEDNNDFTRFKELLQIYKIDISDLVKEEVPMESIMPSDKDMQDNIYDLVNQLEKNDDFQISISGMLISFTKNNDGEIKVHKLTLRHGSDDIFEYYEESEGTRRLFDLLPLLLLPKDRDALVLIDEIDQSLHTLLTQKLIKDLFDISHTSKYQFLITTHDVNLLNQELLRGDEILLLNKNDDTHSSSIKVFSDFKKRADRDVIERYLNGEFGAIPKF